jgi:outer membrane protein assembly factor BamA
VGRCFTLAPGDVAKPNPFGRLIGALQTVYWRAGYADVAFQGDPKLDTEHALASYALQVIAGPIYHLRTVLIENLNPVLQDQFRNFINLAPGDIYDGTVFPTRERMVAAVPALKGYGFGFSPRKDKAEHMVDLTFHFYKD